MIVNLKEIVQDELQKAKENKAQVEREVAENKAKALGNKADPYGKISQDYDDNFKQVAKELTEMVQGKSQVVGTAGDGGNRTYTAFQKTLIQKQKEVNSLYNRCRQITADADKVDLIVENVGDFTPVKVAENATITDAKLTFDKPRLSMAKYGISDSISFELINLDVVSPQMADQITTAMARASVRTREKLLVQGTDTTSGNEVGFASRLKASSPLVPNIDAADKTTVDGITSDDLDNLIFTTFNQNYLSTAVLIMRPNLIRKLLDFGADKAQLFFNSSSLSSASTQGSVGSYRGIPILTTSFLGNAYTTGGITAGKGSVVIIGDLNYLVCGQYTATDIQFSDHVNFTKAQRVYRMLFTYGSQFALSEAFATLSYQAKS